MSKLHYEKTSYEVYLQKKKHIVSKSTTLIDLHKLMRIIQNKIIKKYIIYSYLY